MLKFPIEKKIDFFYDHAIQCTLIIFCMSKHANYKLRACRTITQNSHAEINK